MVFQRNLKRKFKTKKKITPFTDRTHPLLRTKSQIPHSLQIRRQIEFVLGIEINICELRVTCTRLRNGESRKGVIKKKFHTKKKKIGEDEEIVTSDGNDEERLNETSGGSTRDRVSKIAGLCTLTGNFLGLVLFVDVDPEILDAHHI